MGAEDTLSILSRLQQTDFIAARTNSNQAHIEPLFYFWQMKSQSPPPH